MKISSRDSENSYIFHETMKTIRSRKCHNWAEECTGLTTSLYPRQFDNFSFPEYHGFPFCWLTPISINTSYIYCYLYKLWPWLSYKQKTKALVIPHLPSVFFQLLFSAKLLQPCLRCFHFLVPMSLHSTQIALLFPRLHRESLVQVAKEAAISYGHSAFSSTAFYSWSLPPFLKNHEWGFNFLQTALLSYVTHNTPRTHLYNLRYACKPVGPYGRHHEHTEDETSWPRDLRVPLWPARPSRRHLLCSLSGNISLGFWNTSPSNFPFQPLCLRFCWFLISRLSLSRCVLRSARAFSLSVEWRDLIPFRDFTHHWHAQNKTCNLRPASPPRFGTPNPAASPTRLHTKYTG